MVTSTEELHRVKRCGHFATSWPHWHGHQANRRLVATTVRNIYGDQSRIKATLTSSFHYNHPQPLNHIFSLKPPAESQCPHLPNMTLLIVMIRNLDLQPLLHDLRRVGSRSRSLPPSRTFVQHPPTLHSEVLLCKATPQNLVTKESPPCIERSLVSFAGLCQEQPSWRSTSRSLRVSRITARKTKKHL